MQKCVYMTLPKNMVCRAIARNLTEFLKSRFFYSLKDAYLCVRKKLQPIMEAVPLKSQLKKLPGKDHQGKAAAEAAEAERLAEARREELVMKKRKKRRERSPKKKERRRAGEEKKRLEAEEAE